MFSSFNVFLMPFSMSRSRELADRSQGNRDSSLKLHCAQPRNQACLSKKILGASYEEVHSTGEVKSLISQICFTIIIEKLEIGVILNSKKCLLSRRLPSK